MKRKISPLANCLENLKWAKEHSPASFATMLANALAVESFNLYVQGLLGIRKWVYPGKNFDQVAEKIKISL